MNATHEGAAREKEKEERVYRMTAKQPRSNQFIYITFIISYIKLISYLFLRYILIYFILFCNIMRLLDFISKC